MTILAIDGANVAVSCLTAHDAKRSYRDYVERLSRGTDAITWRAHDGDLSVRFEGGGSVRFVSSPHQMDGVDITYETTDELGVLRDFVRHVRETGRLENDGILHAAMPL